MNEWSLYFPTVLLILLSIDTHIQYTHVHTVREICKLGGIAYFDEFSKLGKKKGNRLINYAKKGSRRSSSWSNIHEFF